MATKLKNLLKGNLDEIRTYKGSPFSQAEINWLYKSVTNGGTAYTTNPGYKGRYYQAHPTYTSYVEGDYWLVYGTTDTTIQRGIWALDSDLAPVLLDTTSNSNSEYVLICASDILWAVNNGYGTYSDYGTIQFIQNLIVSTLFATYFKANTALISDLFGENATFSGVLEAVSGLFSGSLESGAIYSAVAAPSTATLTTDDKTAIQFITEIISSGIPQGTYSCSGSYNNSTVRKVVFSVSSSNATQTTTTTNNHYVFYIYDPTTGIYNWKKYTDTWGLYPTISTYTISFYDTDNILISTITNTSTAASSNWTYMSSTYDGYVTGSSYTPTVATAPTTVVPASSSTSILSDGTISFTQDSFTFKLKNLPAYSSDLEENTVYVEADGDNYILKIKGA